jgi:protein-S-isoprenylcysteine O-methyltransferase Ste14
MGKTKTITDKVLYGILFIAVIPLLLILWAKQTGSMVRLAIPGNMLTGYILLSAGLVFVLSGMWHLWIFGHGLAMNAFPPKEFVKKGIYGFTRHPIYAGAIMISFGFSVVTRSASGFWLVSPLSTLMIVAYVVGFENERTETLFGKQDYDPFISLPKKNIDSPLFAERISSYFLAFSPWFIMYEAFIYIGIPVDAINTDFTFEQRWPVWEFSEIFWPIACLFALSVPLVIKTREKLRLFITDIWFATIISGILYLAFPLTATLRVPEPHSFPGHLLSSWRMLDGGTAVLPSSLVIWAFVSARYFSKSIKSFKWVWYIVAGIISASSLTTGINSLSGVIAGFCIFILIIYRDQVWNFIRYRAENLSNSWREWRWGPVRIINHGFYGGAAGFTGTLIAGFFLGRQYAVAAFIIMIFIIIGAGLWAQLIEGSPKLLRPFGYYGGLTGGLVACLLVSLLLPVNIFTLLGSFALAGPWIQSIGRLRCLVQGCCHGKPSGKNIGIRFTHQYSRVNKISGLSGIPLHPTQLYSIGSNIVAGIFLFRFYNVGMSSSFIIGMYFIFNGLGRFVEESFRGEAQTPYWAGMRIYQWIAIINILLGALFTTIPASGILLFQPNIISFFLAIGIGIFVTIASGVDFPESNRRFARLTST